MKEQEEDRYGTFKESPGDLGDKAINAGPQKVEDKTHKKRKYAIIGAVCVLIVVVVFGILAVVMKKGSSGSETETGIARNETSSSSSSSSSETVSGITKETPDVMGAPLSEVEITDTFLSSVDAERIHDYLRQYASYPHSAGTDQDYKTVVYTANKFEEFGIKSEIKTYYPLNSKPISRSLSIVEPAEFAEKLDLDEAVVEGDSCTSDPTALPPFLAYTATGNVTAPVVYVNYGLKSDFDRLADEGVELAGKIALVRYGNNFRGLKVEIAQLYGMVGVIIYSDPIDDGFWKGEVYPDGPWRPENSFQRGSSQFLSIYAGDPLTPGYAATEDAERLSLEEAATVPNIPAIPLSYGQAIHILKLLGGTAAPEDWVGGLNTSYNIGDDFQTVLNLDMVMDNSVMPLWDVIGTIPGTEEPDKYVILGNHRDAWVCGAGDPSSGSAAMMEIVHGFSELLAKGWKPRRTIIFASWDGEEYGLLGSTEWAEDEADDLYKNAVAYLNVDMVSGDTIGAGGSPAIAKYLLDVSKSIPADAYDGEDLAGKTLFEQWQEQKNSLSDAQKDALKYTTMVPDHLISLLGSGTDYTAFYQHLGILSTNIAIEGNYGVYHSTMDSVPYMEKYGDPHFQTHATTAKWWGYLAIKVADAEILPFDYRDYGVVMHQFIDVFEEKLSDISSNVSLADLQAAVDLYASNAESFYASLSNDLSSEEKDAVNQKLLQCERLFLSDAGLPHRTWFKHLIFGPGYFAGYSGTAFPGIADAIDFHDSDEVISAHVADIVQRVRVAAQYFAASDPTLPEFH